MMWTPIEIATVSAAAASLVTAITGLVKSFHTDSKVGAVNAKADAAINAAGELRDTADQHDGQITDMASTVGRVEAAVNVAGKIEDVLAAVKAAGVSPTITNNITAPATSPASDEEASASS